MKHSLSFAAEQRGQAFALALLAYLYALKRLGQQVVQHLAQHSRQHCLPDRFTFDCPVRSRRFAAMIELVDGETAQTRIAINLLRCRCHLDPGVRREGAASALFDTAPSAGLDLIAWAALLTVADIEYLALVIPEQWHNLIDDVTAALSASRGDRDARCRAISLPPPFGVEPGSAQNRVQTRFSAVVWPRGTRGEVIGCYTKFTSNAA